MHKTLRKHFFSYNRLFLQLRSNVQFLLFVEKLMSSRVCRHLSKQQIMQNEFREMSDAVIAHVEYEQNNPRRPRNIFDYAQDRNATGANISHADYRNRLDVAYSSYFPYRRTNHFAEYLQRFSHNYTPQQPVIAIFTENGYNREDEIIMPQPPNTIQQADEIWRRVAVELGWTYHPPEQDQIIFNVSHIQRGKFRAMSIRDYKNATCYTEYKQPIDGHDVDNTNVCSICLETMCDVANCVTTNNCLHNFHKNCLDKWLVDGKHTCPMCRTNIRKI